MRRGCWLLAAVLFLAMVWPISSLAMQGDLDDDGAVGISDAILSLKILAGQTGLDLSEKDDVDVDGDGALGLAEAIFALRQAALPAEGGTARAVLGPLAGGAVRVYRLNDLETPVYETTTDGEGYFDTGATGANPSEYLLVAVSGGMDTDADDDGISDATSTPNSGTIHALMTAYQFQLGGFQVTALSDIAWRYTENLVGEVDGSGLKIRLDDLAGNFFVSDLNEDGEIDARDLLSFLPAVQAHRDALNFDFQLLFAENEDGHSIIGAYHDNLTDVLPALLEETFWTRLSLVPGTDLRYDKVQIEVAAFGRGSVSGDMGGISIDSERADLSENVSKAFLDRNETDQMTLIATPTAETEILSWRGCDAVSDDLTRCEVGLRTDRLVSVSFGYQEASLKSGVTLVDLSGAAVAASEDQVTLDVTADAGDADMIARLAAISVGDIVVGDGGGGFLRKVVSVQRVSDDNYILTTEDATLEEVVAQGTGVFSKQMTHGDLAETIRSGVRSGNISGGFESLPGVRLIPSERDDTVFAIEIGDPRSRESIGVEDSLKWIDPGTGVTVEAKGTVEVSIEFDIGVSYGLPSGMEHFKFIPEVSATESIDISMSGEVETPENAFQKEIGKIRFKKIVFFVGPVPVWIEPQVKIVLGFTAKADGKISAGITLTQVVRSGVVYDRAAGANMVGEFTPSYELKPPTAEFSVEAKPFVETNPVVYIYGVTGPSIDLESYLRLRGEAESKIFFNALCDGGLSFAAYAGISAGFEWDMGAAKKLGDWADQVKLDKKLFDKEVLLKTWNVDGVCVGDRFTNSLGMTFVRIPAGTFMMGSPEDELGRDSDETRHQVTLTQNYYMMTTEVTQAQWEAVMGENPSYFTYCGGDCPVERVSWNDIWDFIAALNAMDGRTYRLPTEAEWEYAARAGTTTAFYNGGITHTSTFYVDPNLDEIGWYGGNSDVSYMPPNLASLGRGPHPVARKQPNAFGLYDMSGNVWEWVQDRYGSYPDGAVTDPAGPDPHTGSNRVRRGGSWRFGARECRSAERRSLHWSSRNSHYGFRLALSPGQ